MLQLRSNYMVTVLRIKKLSVPFKTQMDYMYMESRVWETDNMLYHKTTMHYFASLLQLFFTYAWQSFLKIYKKI